MYGSFESTIAIPQVSVAAEKAVTYAVKLAAATRRGEWVNFAFELYTVLRKPLPGPVSNAITLSGPAPAGIEVILAIPPIFSETRLAWLSA